MNSEKSIPEIRAGKKKLVANNKKNSIQRIDGKTNKEE